MPPDREQHVRQAGDAPRHPVEGEDEPARLALRQSPQQRAPARDPEQHRRPDHAVELEVLATERDDVAIRALERVLVRHRRVPEAQRGRRLRRAHAVDAVPQPAHARRQAGVVDEAQDEPPAGREHAGHLAHAEIGRGEVVERRVAQHPIEGSVGKRESFADAAHQLQPHAESLHVIARPGEERRRRLEHDALEALLGQVTCMQRFRRGHLEHATGRAARGERHGLRPQVPQQPLVLETRRPAAAHGVGTPRVLDLEFRSRHETFSLAGRPAGKREPDRRRTRIRGAPDAKTPF